MNNTAKAIAYLPFDKFTEFRRECSFKLNKISKNGYDIWCRLDDSVCKTIERHGKKVGSDDDVDFFRTGDWFHEYTYGLSIQTTTCLSLKLLQDLQIDARNHHKLAMITLGGCHDDINGLDILMYHSGIYAAWQDRDAKFCREKLESANIFLA